MKILNLLKQPSAFYFVFLIEIIERFCYYGAISLLFVYLVNKIGMTNSDAERIISTFTILMFLPIFIGGFLSDSYLGEKKTLVIGAFLLMVGYLSLAILKKNEVTFALSLIVVGNLFFKTQPSALIGRFVAKKQKLTDSIFTLYYMAVNIGSFLGMLLIPRMFDPGSYSSAALLCAFGMLVVLLATLSRYKKIPGTLVNYNKKLYFYLLILVFCLAVLFYASLNYAIFFIIFSVLLFIVASSVFCKKLNSYAKKDRRKLILVLILMAQALIFFVPNWYPSLTLKYFSTHFAGGTIFGFEIRPAFFQTLNPFWIFILSPILAYFYSFREKQGHDIHITTKFSLGILSCGLGFLLLPAGAYFKINPEYVSANWIFFSYFFLALGELLISGLGLAMITRLVRSGDYGFMMGFWFIVTPVAFLMGNWLPISNTNVGMAAASLKFLTRPSLRFKPPALAG